MPARDRILVVEAVIGHDADSIEVRHGLAAGAFKKRLAELRVDLEGVT